MLQEVRDNKKDRDSELTRKIILDAAEKLFSERGFAGTSVRDISEASGVSQPLIHHHFGSKKMLYHEVKKRAIERFWERWTHRSLPDESGRDLKPEIFLSEGIESFFWFVRDNENIIRLSIWACLEGDTDLWPGEKESVEILAQQVARAQEAGIINPNVDPRMFTIMIEAVTIFWWQYRSNLVRLFFDEGKIFDRKVLDTLDRLYLDNVLRIFSGCKAGARHEEEGKENK
ncbi:MAG: TetR/AcrR family transcriptional regulator [Syntrophobacterales bacterium]|nr:TetR/AcrR family transcriptional regulator [Syntrophobacterales bacterium]